MPNRPRVRAVIGIFERSSSRAVHVDTDAGEYVIKVANNPEGPRVLVNEWIGTAVARRLGVLTPAFTIVEVPDLIEIPLRPGLMAQPGPAFASRFERGQPWGGRAGLRGVANLAAVSHLVVLDTWLRNVDRHSLSSDGRHTRTNRQNVWLSTEDAPQGRFLLKAIDQGHCFGGTSWQARQLRAIEAVNDRRVYGLFSEFRDHLNRSEVGDAIRAMNRVSTATLRGILAGIPRQWGLSQAEAAAIVEFLRDRASYLSRELPAMLWLQGELGRGRW